MFTYHIPQNVSTLCGHTITNITNNKIDFVYVEFYEF